MDTPEDQEKKIELTPFLERLAVAEGEAAAARATLANAEQHVTTLRCDMQEELRARLASGATTGDPLKDEVVDQFGFEPDRIAKFQAFSEELVASKGKEFLIIIHWEARTLFRAAISPSLHGLIPFPDDEEWCMPMRAYVLGHLTGERLKIVPGAKELGSFGAGLSLPFSRHAVMGFEGQGNRPELTLGPLVVRAGYGNYGYETLMLRILGLPKPSHLDMLLGHFQKDESGEIYILGASDPAPDATIPIEKLRDALRTNLL